MISQTLRKGILLISEPFLGDANFERSVVLICEHNDQGSFGFVLNQKTDEILKNIWEEINFATLPVYIGGPVQKNTLHFIHRLGSKIADSIEIAEDLYWGGDYEQVIALLNQGRINEQDIRFFLGYSGWGSGQLEREMEQNAWIIAEAEASFIFDTPHENFWRSILRKMGGKYKVLSNYPIDPSLN